jgi:hypothetical protein
MIALIREHSIQGGSGMISKVKFHCISHFLDLLYHSETWDLCLRRCNTNEDF